ncbi:hypothetical protein BSKO_06165 [Bryopsis sp. KO-2023]|nr:hypothetical protein BSKO_06165 [Bryopsis sp. KO-2023]
MTGGDTPKSRLSLVNWVSTPIRSAARSLSWIAGRASEARKVEGEPVVNQPELSGGVGTPAQVDGDGNGEHRNETPVHAGVTVEKEENLDGEKREVPDADDAEAIEARRQEELRNVSTTSDAHGGLPQYDTSGAVEKMRQVRKRRNSRKNARKNGAKKTASAGVPTTNTEMTPGKQQQAQGKGKGETVEKSEVGATEKNLVEIQVADSPRDAATQPKSENAKDENGEVVPDAMDDDAGDVQVTPQSKSRKRASSEVIDEERPKKRMLPMFRMSLAKSFKLGGSVQKTTEPKPVRSGSLVERLLGASPLWGKTNPGQQSDVPLPSPIKEGTENENENENSAPHKSTTPRTSSYRLLASGGDTSNEEKAKKETHL